MSFVSLKICCFNPVLYENGVLNVQTSNRTTPPRITLSKESITSINNAIQTANEAANKAEKYANQAKFFSTSALIAIDKANEFFAKEAARNPAEEREKIYAAAEAELNKISNCTIKEFSVRIIDAKTYDDRKKALDSVRMVAQSAFKFGERLSEEYNGKTQYHNLLAVNEKNEIVGFLSGEIQDFRNKKKFYVHLIAVIPKYSSSEGVPSTEKVGTRLLLQAMAKAQILGLKILSLRCTHVNEVSSNNDEEGDEFISTDQRFYDDCYRRVAFYDNIMNKFNIQRTIAKQNRTYYDFEYHLTSYNFKNSLEILNTEKLKSLQNIKLLS